MDTSMAATQKDVRLQMANFDINAILRGAQLTLVGAHRALQNPQLFTSEHYRQAAIAVGAGIVVRLVLEAPIFLVKIAAWFMSFVISFDVATWDHHLDHSVRFLTNQVLQLPFFLFSLMRYITPTLDNLFMESLRWVDLTYMQKHKSEDPSTLRAMYHANLRMYSQRGGTMPKKSPVEAITGFLIRFSRRAGISLAIFALSYIPIIGKLVLPAASFYTFRKAVGTLPASVIFGCGVFLPRHYLVVFLQSYFASRSLMRELLEPYFSRVHFTQDQKRSFFRDREGVLFGFGVGFYVFLKVPLLGVLIYGIAEASTAYLITKITDPPPPPAYSDKFAASQVHWTNKHEFLRLPLEKLDAYNVSEEATPAKVDRTPKQHELPQKKFS